MITTYHEAWVYLGQEFLQLIEQGKRASVQDVVNRATAGTLFLWLNKHYNLIIDGFNDAAARSLCKFFQVAVPDAKIEDGFPALIHACFEGISIFKDRPAYADLY